MLFLTISRSFEFLAATTATAGTRVPGPGSFTTALIHSLDCLVQEKPEGRFTTVELLRKIKEAPDFPSDQTPKLFDRENLGTAGRIMLHPLSPAGQQSPTSPEEVAPSEIAKQTVALHFDFDHRPALQIIETLGNEFNHMCRWNALGINGIRWGGVKQSMTARAVQTFLEVRDRKAIERERESIAAQSGGEWSGELTPEPRTPSSISRYSPQIVEGVTNDDTVIDPSYLSAETPSKVSHKSDSPRRGRSKRRKVT